MWHPDEVLPEPASGPRGRPVQAVLKTLLAAAGQKGVDFAVSRLRPKLEPIIEKQGLTWDDALPAIEQVVPAPLSVSWGGQWLQDSHVWHAQVTSLDELMAAMHDPDAFLQNLLSAAGAHRTVEEMLQCLAFMSHSLRCDWAWLGAVSAAGPAAALR